MDSGPPPPLLPFLLRHEEHDGCEVHCDDLTAGESVRSWAWQRPGPASLWEEGRWLRSKADEEKSLRGVIS